MEGSNKFAGCRAQVPQAQRPPCQCFFLILRPLLRAQASRASAAQHPNRYGMCAVGGCAVGRVRTDHGPAIPRAARRRRDKGHLALNGKLRLLERPLHPPSNKTRRPTAAPEQYHLRTNLGFGDPPAATAAAAASPQREAAAAPVLGSVPSSSRRPGATAGPALEEETAPPISTRSDDSPPARHGETPPSYLWPGT